MTDTPGSALPAWPDTAPDAATLIAYHAAHGLAAVNRFYATVPPDRNDTEAITRWMSDVPTLAHAFNVAACLTALRKADPAEADRTAAFIWWMAEAGEQGESLYEWAIEAGFDTAAIVAEAKATVVARGGTLMFPEVPR